MSSRLAARLIGAALVATLLVACSPATGAGGGGANANGPTTATEPVIDPTTGLVVGTPTSVPGSVGGSYLFSPGATSTSRMVVFVHGGSWTGGSIYDVPWWITAMAAQGWHVVSVGYRTSVAHPGAANDVGAAVRYLQTVTGIPSERTVLVGLSAGGHLAELVAFGENNAKPYGAPVGTLVTMSPAHRVEGLAQHNYALGDAVTQGLLRCNPGIVNFGGFPDCAANSVAQAEPRNLIDAADPPTFTALFEDDFVVPPSLGGYALDYDLRAAGASSTLSSFGGPFHDCDDSGSPEQSAMRTTVVGWISGAVSAS